jgi:zinc and cadmium transporter
MQAVVLSFASVIVVSLVSLIGLVTLSWGEARVRQASLAFVAFAVGALLGDAFIHLLPEAYAAHRPALATGLMVAAGAGAFYLLERGLRRWAEGHHGVVQHGHVHPVVGVNLVADALHNLVDGMLIAASYLADVRLGVSTTVAVLLHEIPQEIGDFGILIHGGLSVRRALLLNLLSALTAVVGTGVTLALGRAVQPLAVAVVPITAGGFLYIALADLVPELQRQPVSTREELLRVTLLLAGLGVMVALAFIE